MINKKYYCDICDKYILKKSSHNKTKLHTQLSLSIVNKYYVNNISVNEIDNVINNHVYDYNKKFHNFDCWCIIQNGYFCEKINLIKKFVPDIIKIQKEIIKRYRCKQDDLVYMKISFIADLKNATYNHYFQLPKPMIGRRICRIIDLKPKLIKTLNHMPEPYKRHIVTKHWGVRHDDNENYVVIPETWMDLEPNIF